ncbi:hypothetical protein MOD48_14980 [Bacillus spizizenii]|nr:hypothetical protein [Bacillus spizizenii]
MSRDKPSITIKPPKKTLAKGIKLSLEEPPLGVIPKSLHDERRAEDLKAAINRYIDANREIPAEWIEEYNLLVKPIKTKGGNN